METFPAAIGVDRQKGDTSLLPTRNAGVEYAPWGQNLVEGLRWFRILVLCTYLVQSQLHSH